MASSSEPKVADVLKLWTSIPTRALMKRYQRTESCDKARASAVCTAYKHFIALKILASDHDDDLLSAPPSVHAMWREHILDTAAYADHCKALCGRTLHHAPDAMVDDEAKRVRRCQRTLVLYKKHIGDAPPAVWDFGELPALSRDEERQLADEEAPAAKRAKSGAKGGGGGAATGAPISVSVQAPFLPLRTVSTRSDVRVSTFFQTFVDASGSTHLVPGRNATPQTTRLRCANAWLHDLQTLSEGGVSDGAIVYVCVPQERHSRDQLALVVKDVAAGESATVYVRACDSVSQLSRQAQDALGVPADAQQLVFRGAVLEQHDTLAALHLADGSTLQMVVGRRRPKEAEMSPGGTWRV